MAGVSSEARSTRPASDAKPVVVTGAGGFIGRSLVGHFAATERPCRAIVREFEADVHAPPDVFPVGDLASVPDARLDVILRGAFAIVHLAGRVHVLAESAADPEAAYEAANVTATVRLAHAAVRAGVRRFVLASTVKVNGEESAPGRPFRPGDPPDPRDAYARSKLAAERQLAEIARGTDMAPIVLRLPLVYGPGVRGNFATLIEEVARERRLPLAAIRNHRSLLYVGNFADAIDAALGATPAPSGVHFVTDAIGVSVPALASAIGAALGVPARLTSVPVPLLELAAALTGRRALVSRLVGNLEADTASFIAATGWAPPHGLVDGLAATAAWWRLRHAL